MSRIIRLFRQLIVLGILAAVVVSLPAAVQARTSLSQLQAQINALQAQIDALGGDGTAPLVQLELPDKAFTRECLSIAPEVSDDTGISIVQLFINGVIGSSDIRSDPPFEFNRCGPGSPGFVEFKVLAWDFSGNVGSASSTVEFVIPDATQLSTLSFTIDTPFSNPSALPGVVNGTLSLSITQIGTALSGTATILALTLDGSPVSTDPSTFPIFGNISGAGWSITMGTDGSTFFDISSDLGRLFLSFNSNGGDGVVDELTGEASFRLDRVAVGLGSWLLN